MVIWEEELVKTPKGQNYCNTDHMHHIHGFHCLFHGFKAVLDPLLAPKLKRGIEGTIGEIGDLLNAFVTQLMQHHKLL